MELILHVLRTGYRWKILPKEHGSDSDCTCHRDWSKKYYRRFIPDIIVENNLEYDDKIIEKIIIYFVAKASGNYNYQIHNIPAGIDRSHTAFLR